MPAPEAPATNGTAEPAATGADRQSAVERQEAARQAYRRSVADGKPLTGAALGEMFDRSARWGTDRAAEVRAELGAALAVGDHQNTPGNLYRLPIGNGLPPGVTPETAPAETLPADTRRHSASAATVPATEHTPPPSGTGPGEPPTVARSTPAEAAAASRSVAADQQPRPVTGNEPHANRQPAEEAAERRWERIALTVGKAAVRLVAAAVSYEHMRKVAEAAGETGWRALVLPISVDGLAVLALVTMRQQRRDGLRPSTWAWVALILALVASLAANVAAAQPTPAGRLVAAWPPVALFLAEVLDKPRSVGPQREASPDHHENALRPSAL